MICKAPLSTGGTCPHCKTTISGRRRTKKRCIKCDKIVSNEELAVYFFTLNSYHLRFLTEVFPLHGAYFQPREFETLLVGRTKKVLLPKRYSHIRTIKLFPLKEDVGKTIQTSVGKIRKKSFDVLSSGRNQDLNKSVRFMYSLSSMDNRLSFPLWYEYLQTGLDLMRKQDYKTSIVMWVSILDSCFDATLSRKIAYYDVTSGQLDILLKLKLLKKVFPKRYDGLTGKLSKLAEIRNKIVHGKRASCSVNLEICNKYLRLVLVVSCLTILKKPSTTLCNELKQLL